MGGCVHVLVWGGGGGEGVQIFFYSLWMPHQTFGVASCAAAAWEVLPCTMASKQSFNAQADFVLQNCLDPFDPVRSTCLHSEVFFILFQPFTQSCASSWRRLQWNPWWKAILMTVREDTSSTTTFADIYFVSKALTKDHQGIFLI